MNNCAVIMSTFNGEKFLKMQIDSILQQEDVSVDLYIRDDGSCDGTKEIINSYAHLSDRVHFLNPTEKINLGYRRSFIHALKTVVDFSGGYDYYAFSDQDDVWVKEKLAVSISKLKVYKGKALFVSNRTPCDDKLQIIGKEQGIAQKGIYDTLGDVAAPGSTMVFTRELAQIFSLYELPDINVNWGHDSFLYRLAKLVGADVVFDEKSYLYYRIHTNNAVGQYTTVNERDFSDYKKIFKFLNVIKHIKEGKLKHPTDRQKLFAIIYYCYNEYLTNEARKFCLDVLLYDKKLSSRIKLALCKYARKKEFRFWIDWCRGLVYRLY